MKYKLTKNTKDHYGTTLYQIEAVASFGNVKKGELGGWIEKEANLSQDGDAWVSGDARVYGKLRIEAGFFFGVRYNKEEIKYYPLDEENELIYKGDAVVSEAPREDNKNEWLKRGEKEGRLEDGKIVKS